MVIAVTLPPQRRPLQHLQHHCHPGGPGIAAMPPAPTPRPPPAPQRHLAPSGSGRPLPAPPPTTAQDRIRQPWSEVQRGCSVLIITCLPTLMTAAACPLGSATHDERAAVLNHCPVQSVAPHLPLLLAGRLRRLLQRGPGLRGGEGVPPTPQEQQGQAQLHQRHISHLVLAAPWWSFRRWGGGRGCTVARHRCP